MLSPMLRHRWLLVAALSGVAFGCDDGRAGPDMGDGGVAPTCEATTPVECAADMITAVPVRMTATTVGARDSFGQTCAAGPGGRDVTFMFTAPEAGFYEIDTLGSDFDTVLSVRTDCTGATVVECNDDIQRGMETRSKVSVELAACETVLIIVDGYNADEMGNVVLNIGTQEQICDDGIDNDEDGMADCDDPDCFSIDCSGDDWPAPWQDFEWEVVELTNQERAMGANCGGEDFPPAGPLEMDALIRDAARAHSSDMGELGYFQHDSLDGAPCDGAANPCDFADRMRYAGFMGDQPWGENIAAGQTTPADVVRAWMESPGHCRNIMNPSYQTIGVGYALVEGSPLGHYWTQDFAASH